MNLHVRGATAAQSNIGVHSVLEDRTKSKSKTNLRDQGA